MMKLCFIGSLRLLRCLRRTVLWLVMSHIRRSSKDLYTIAVVFYEELLLSLTSPSNVVELSSSTWILNILDAMP